MFKRKTPTVATETISLDISRIDWAMLKSQKMSLVDTIDSLEVLGLSYKRDDLTGILNLIDFLQDKASESIGETRVFKAVPDIR